MSRTTAPAQESTGKIILVLKGNDDTKRVGIVHAGREYDFYEGAHTGLPEDVGRAIMAENPDLPLVEVKLVNGRFVEQRRKKREDAA